MEETGLVKVNEFKELISKAPQILEENRLSCTRAKARAAELIEMSKVKMDAVLDEQISDYIDKAKKTMSGMNIKRSSFTQTMTYVAKEFTSLEASVKLTVEDCQKVRDAYATDLALKEKEKQRLAAEKLAKENELIELKKYFSIGHANAYADFLLDFKTKKNAWFNALTLETITKSKAEILNFDNNLSDSMFNFKVADPSFVRVTKQEYYDLIHDQVMSSCYACMAQFRTDISGFIRDMIDMIPSKKQQLDEIETARLEGIRKQKEEAERQRRLIIQAAWDQRKANREADVLKKAELERIAKDAELKAAADKIANKLAEAKRKSDALVEAQKELERQKEEKEKLDLESDKLRLEAEANAQIKASGERAGAMADSQAELFTESPKIKEGYEILIFNKAAYLLLAQFWFEKEGKELTDKKFEVMTFIRIKEFCEKWAIKNDEFVESRLIEYKPIYKAK